MYNKIKKFRGRPSNDNGVDKEMKSALKGLKSKTPSSFKKGDLSDFLRVTKLGKHETPHDALEEK